MRLSEYERRVLAGLDGDLLGSDPRFVRRFRRGSGRGLRPTALLFGGRSGVPGRMLRLLGHWWG